jgi:hypothetical protein
VASKKLQSYTANPSWTEPQIKKWDQVQLALPIALGYVGDIPVLDNHSDADLIDEVGVLKQAKKCIEVAEKAHVERLKARMGNQDKLFGSSYVATYRGGSRIILNQEKCKEVITAFDEEGIHLERLLAALKSGQIQVPDNIKLLPTKPDPTLDGAELNYDTFFTTAGGGRSLYVEPIA